ncbi:zonular occludens toxin [Vibrio pectenicida]|uniref:Zonular occludens toxin n=1 Tax=Vibrio pectenicida TaxID=62763 RepID=A0A7Y4A2P1_9VIBR|nr:zonular occludens toxin domain-containing protein [Vibrio pectenicida]NOH73351.1 zonular occludens toxin [Vibrio pectenicida]
MAVYFRHGSNGSYKTAYAVWFEILPALRSGRVVVTNIEGIKPLKTIESLLGEKFPVGARLVRLFTRKQSGIELWQNWFNWMPVNALVVIDECQDIFAPEVGFKREKALKRPIEDFTDSLPDDFLELFYERWGMADTTDLDDGDIDDVGETQLDDKGRLLYPDNYYGAFMRHRKYQWDIILLTPDFTSIPRWMLGCATDAFSHTSTDTFFRKRKPRIYNHRPKSSKTAPSTRQDLASCVNKKIPLDVFALYQSTGTGGFNASKADISILKSPKFIFAITVAVVALANFAREAYAIYNRNNDNLPQASVEKTDTMQATAQNGDSQSLDDNAACSQGANGVANCNGSNENSHQVSFDAVNPFYRSFPIFNNAKSVHLTSVVQVRHEQFITFDYRFRIDKADGSYYIGSQVLSAYGYEFAYIDDCLIEVHFDNTSRMLSCPPRQTIAESPDTREDAIKEIDIFNLSEAEEV